MTTSKKNIKDASSDTSSEFATLVEEVSAQKDYQIDELQQKLLGSENARKEERFLFVLVVVILFDILLFTAIDSFGGPLAILVLELIALAVVARRMGLTEVMHLVQSTYGNLLTQKRDGADPKV